MRGSEYEEVMNEVGGFVTLKYVAGGTRGRTSNSTSGGRHDGGLQPYAKSCDLSIKVLDCFSDLRIEKQQSNEIIYPNISTCHF